MYNEKTGWAELNDHPVFGVFKEDDEWVLVAFSIQRKEEVATTDRRGGTRMKLRGRWLLLDNYTAENGIELERASTKKALMKYVSADGSTRVDTGEYLVYPKNNPRKQFEEVDRDEYNTFTQQARRIYD